MRLFCYYITVFLLLSFKGYAQYEPQHDLGELFVKVQMERIFPDSKTFADCTPLISVDSIKNQYNRQKNLSNFSLKAFVAQCFATPATTSIKLSDTFPAIERHIDSLWDQLIRFKKTSEGSLVGLPYPYTVPGGRFNEMYYWDSYFTMLGLQTSGKISTIQNMVDNFAYLIKKYGFVPNGNRTYYLTRSQPPFFSMMVELLGKIKSDTVYVHYLPELLEEYHFWMNGADKLNQKLLANKRVVFLSNKTILNRYWDNDSTPRAEAYKEDVDIASLSGRSHGTVYRNIRAACESGWDFSSRWFADGISLSSIQTTNIIPVDLNCLMYKLEICIAKAYQLKKDNNKAEQYLVKAESRKKAILLYCWDENIGFFTDYNFVKQCSASVLSLAGMFPLYFQIANKWQAQQVADKIQKYFIKPGGLVATLTLSNQQWDAPNGWAPLQWISCEALENYGYNTLADTIKQKWTSAVNKTYLKSGKLLEKYNVLYPEIPGGGGEYPSQDGFGWTNGVFLNMHLDKK